MTKPKGYVVTWVENGQDRWEFTAEDAMFVHLYETALAKCGEQNVYVFPVSDLLTLTGTKLLVSIKKAGGKGAEKF